MLRKYTAFLLHPLHYTNDPIQALKSNTKNKSHLVTEKKLLPRRHYEMERDEIRFSGFTLFLSTLTEFLGYL